MVSPLSIHHYVSLWNSLPKDVMDTKRTGKIHKDNFIKYMRITEYMEKTMT